MVDTVTITTDPRYMCPTNGTSDCRDAFLLFKDDYQGQEVILEIPNRLALDADEGNVFDGIANLTINAHGSLFIGYGTGFGSVGAFQNTSGTNTHMAPLVTRL
jgi:hypothetical protein